MYSENIYNPINNKINLSDGKLFNQDKNFFSSLFNGYVKPFMGSIVEAQTNYNDVNLNDLCDENNELYNLEICFQRTLQKYNNAYNLISQDILFENEIKSVNKNILNNVIENDGNYYYVNNFGYTHKYTNDLDNNDISCPETPIEYSGSMDDLLSGPDMNEGQPCNIAGRVIQNKGTGEYAWVDIEGIKHIFPDEIWNDKDESCEPPSSGPNSLLLIDEDKYNLIPSGSNMESTTTCSYFKLNPTTLQLVGELNNKLLELSAKIISEIDNLNVKDENQRQQLQVKRDEMYKQYNTSLKNKNKFYNTEKNRFNSFNASEQETSYLVNSSFYQYWLWLLVAIIVVYFAVQNFVSSNDQQVNTSTLLVVLILVLFTMILMYKKLRKFFN
tara:strand:+ start:1505 stop:2662 length:1158 start_codon:yes stop_codon:yes gene_type:complete